MEQRSFVVHQVPVHAVTNIGYPEILMQLK